MTVSQLTTPVIDPRSELADVLDAILRDLGQVVHYDQVRILLLPSVLDFQKGASVEEEEEEATLLITVRESGATGTLQGSLEPSPLGRYPLNRLLMTSQKPIVISDTRKNELWVAAPAHTWEIRSWIGAPLVVKGESIGVLAVHSLVADAYNERDGIIVFAFASQAAEAIDKVRLLDQAQNRLHAMMALYEASLDVLGHSPEPDRLLHTLVRRAVDLLRAEAGGIYLVDPDRTSLRLAITHGFVDAYRGVGIKIGEGLIGHVFQSSQPQIVNDYQRWPHKTAPFSEDPRFSAILGVPLRWESGLLGVLEICANTLVRKFSVEDRWLAELFANQVSMAMSNARLIEQSRRRLAELSALRDVSLQMTSTLELDRVLDAICANVMSLTAAEDTHIYLYDAEADAFTKSVALWRSGLRKPTASQLPHAGLIDRVRRSGRPIVIDNALKHELYATPEAAQWGIKSIAGFPLKRAGAVLGAFTVSYLVVHRFGEDELRVLTLLANQASIAIDNALSYQKLQAALLEREHTQQALIQSESLAAVGQLVAGVAHELNNPLASVSSLIQSALETMGLPYQPITDSAATLPIIRPDAVAPLKTTDVVEVADDLAFSLKELRRAKGIVSSLLDLSRQSQSYTEEVSLTVVCQDALRILHNRIKLLPIEIVEHYQEDLPLVRGNFANLGQVALNMIQNAVDAFEQKPGCIEIGTGDDAARGIVWFYVKDNGPGIPDQVLPSIFHPFYTTKGVGIGTGLGLYISYEIVKKHGGEIIVETAPGQGTLFRVELPTIAETG
ncbi:MAG TPA: GAF domain-containing protein [Anaerolineae bacterium]|nr:GAF domain-containing protein [Anaerolineae bacterium]